MSAAFYEYDQREETFSQAVTQLDEEQSRALSGIKGRLQVVSQFIYAAVSLVKSSQSGRVLRFESNRLRAFIGYAADQKLQQQRFPCQCSPVVVS